MAKNEKVEVTVLVGTLTDGDQSAGPNELFMLNAHEVDDLVKRGIVRTGKPTVTPPAGATGLSNDRLIIYIQAIGTLDPKVKGHFTEDGKPEVAALKDLIDDKVTDAERDEAWEHVKKLKAK